jgi:ADP-ribosylglycohydrolase
MPNGGSDCCGTCWFNRSNRGQAGHGKGDASIPPVCEIRDFAIESAFYTYCANHPKRAPERNVIPIGPVSVDNGQGREFWRPSPDTMAIRDHLLMLLSRIEQAPRSEYPLGATLDSVIIWQLGEFGEARAIPDLERIARFSPHARGEGPFAQTREQLIASAHAALEKIRAHAAHPGALQSPDVAPAISLEDRVFGVLFGQAVGDALGLGSEFMSRKDVEWYYPNGLTHYDQIIQDAHRKRWKRGSWTDDTEQMTMILDSLLETGGVDVRDIGRRISNWVFYAQGVGVGNTVYAVLKHPTFAEDPHGAACAVWEETGRRAAANGGVMRTSVLGLWDFDDPARIRANAEAACKVTHYDPRCVASCVAVSLLVNALARGQAPDRSLIEEVRAIANTYDVRVDEAFEHAANPDIAALELDSEEAIGYTLKPLAAGLWALAHARGFEDGLLRIVAQGGDADSNASVTGALLGARHGLRAIPTRLVRGLTNSKYLARVSKSLLAQIAPGDDAVAASAAVLELEAGGTLTDGSVVAYVKRAVAEADAPWVLFAHGTWVAPGRGDGDLDPVARAVAKLDSLPVTGGEAEHVRRLGHTEGWVVGDPQSGVFTFVHPLELNRAAPRDVDIADHARFKRGRDAQQHRVIHVTSS